MASVAERFNGNLPNFSATERVDLYRDLFCTIIDDQEYEISYNDPDAEEIMRQMNDSILELRIVECPSNDIQLTFSRFIFGARHELKANATYFAKHLEISPFWMYVFIYSVLSLRRIEIYDRIPDTEEQWIRRNTNAVVEEHVTKISQLASEASTGKVLILDRKLEFGQLAYDFDDRTSYASVKELHIVGEFLFNHLTEGDIHMFTNFINDFPKLKTIDACFILKAVPVFQGFDFYEKMVRIERDMFDGLPKELHGIIHFGAEVQHIGDMPDEMREDIKKNWSKVKHPIIIDEEKGCIKRKFKMNKGFSLNYRNYFRHELKIKLSINAVPH